MVARAFFGSFEGRPNAPAHNADVPGPPLATAADTGPYDEARRHGSLAGRAPVAPGTAPPSVRDRASPMSTSFADPRPQGAPEPSAPGSRAFSREAFAERILSRRPLSARELAVAAGLLAALALGMSIGHIRRGGFYYDDWGVLSIV